MQVPGTILKEGRWLTRQHEKKGLNEPKMENMKKGRAIKCLADEARSDTFHVQGGQLENNEVRIWFLLQL